MFNAVYYKNDTVFKILNVTNATTGEPITNAHAKVNGIKLYGTETFISPDMFPINLDSMDNGIYLGILPHTLDLIPNTKYICMIELDTEEGMQAYWEFTFTCRLRQE
jgi:hypothetical protein